MTQRLGIALLAFASIAFPQTLPSYQWALEVDGSGSDSLAGLGTDAQGNIYIAGSTSSQHFPVKNAAQPVIASAGLYRISGTSFTALGLASCSSLAVDPQNPSIILAVSNGALVKSIDAGVTFAAMSLPSSEVLSVSIQPGNDQILFAGTIDQGLLRSADGGATWTAANNGLPANNEGQITVQNVWIDPANVSVVFAATPNGLARSTDGAANWQVTTISDTIQNITFDAANAGFVYVSAYHEGLLRSTDFGQTFTPFGAAGITEVVPDPIQPSRLIGVGSGLYQSTDGGVTWTQESTTFLAPDLVADSVNGVYYATSGRGTGIFRIAGNLQTVTQVGPSVSIGNATSLAVVNGQLYAANGGSSDVFVSKLDPAGNILYSTYLGGSDNDQAIAMTVDAAGNVFVAGTTNSTDFPVSEGAYASAGNVFLARLNPDGSLGYSTYFSGTVPVAVAGDGSGSAWLAGVAGETQGSFPTTPGALSTTFCCYGPPGVPGIGPSPIPEEATLTRFAPSGSSLVFSTYVAGSSISPILGTPIPVSALVLAQDASAYLGGAAGVFHVDSTGSTLLGSMTNPPVRASALAIGPDGSVYVAGAPQNLTATASAFQTSASSDAAIIWVDAGLANTIDATYFGNFSQVQRMTTDAGGNVYIGGATGSTGLPTRTPLVGGFATPTGFMSELSGDLSTLLFSSYFGDNERFTVSGLAIGQNGSVVIGGVTNQNYNPGNAGNVWLNSLALAPPPSLRIDSVENAASVVDGPIAAGETIFVNGVGFGGNAQLSIGGTAVAPNSITATRITATVPAGLPAAAATVEVQSGGASSNAVLMPVAVTAPGIFSQDGSGSGQGYILNKDGTLNSPSNPAAPGEPITVFATGVGPMTFTDCCAVTQYPVNVFIEGVYCAGIAAILGPANGLPGSVYQISVYVPNPAVLFADSDPTFTFPPLDVLMMQVNGVNSQPGIKISIAQ